MKKIGLYGFAFLFIFACSLFAQTLKSDAWITNGAIYSIVQKGNITYLGGNFHQVGPYTGAASLISTTDVKPDLRFPRIEGAVTSVASDGNGGWFIGGEFMRVGGVFFMNLVHIKSDNTIDMSWMPNPNGEVTSLLYVNNILYVGGEFTSISGQTRGFAAAYDQNGQLLSWNPNANAAVNAIAVDGNTIYLGGDFMTVGGESRNHIAAVDVNGQLTNWDPGADLPVSSLAVSGNIVYAGGDFTFIGGQTRNYIAAIDQSGAATAWNPNPNKAVIALLASNNLLFVGGDFTNIGGRQRNYIAALDLNTGLATQFNPIANESVNSFALSGSLLYVGGDFTGIGGYPRSYAAAIDLNNGMVTQWNPMANGAINSIAASGNFACAGGYFTSVGGKVRHFIAALDQSGQATSWAPQADGPVKALAVSGNIVYAGGTFTAMGGEYRNNLAAVDESGNLTAWNPNVTGGGQLKGINALAVKGDIIYAGGTFTSVGGQNRNNLAALDLNGNATAWNPNPGGTFVNSVNALGVSGDIVYVGGNFTNIGGKIRNNIAAIDINGQATAWNPNAGGNLINTVNTLATDDKTVYAGGFFTNIGGEARNYLGSVDENGVATAWNPDASGNLVKNVKTILPLGNTILVGGNFTNIGGENRNYVAAIDEAGKATAWNPNASFPVNSMVLANDQILTGGEFFNICNQIRPYYASLSLPEGIKLKIFATAGDNGTISPSGLTYVDYGANQSYTITPKTGYHIADVKVDGQSIGAVTNYTFNSVIANHKISATFEINVYAITSSAGEHGAINPNGVTNVTYGSNQTYTITPDLGYHVVDVIVDGVSKGALREYTFTSVAENHTISATFAIDVFTITATSGEHGTVSPAGATNINYGSSLVYTITPEVGYHVADVLVDGISQGPVKSYTFGDVTANHTISATFAIDVFTIAAASGEHGTVSPIGTSEVNYGGSKTYSISADKGYHIVDVLVDGQSVGAITSYTFSNVKANHTISASFAIDVFSITASAGEHGTITPSGITNVNYGTNQAYSIVPNTGYHIADVLVDGQSVGVVSSYTFNSVEANHTISASFAIDVFTITANCDENGTIAPSGLTQVNYGGSQLYTITPKTGYHISDVQVDGVSQGAIQTYTFSNVTANHTISAKFALDVFTITATSGEHGTITPGGVTNVNYGASQVYNVTPDQGYHVVDVLVDGKSVGAVSSYTFTNVTANHTISATFVINVYTITAASGENGTLTPSGATFVNFCGSQTYTITPNAGYHLADVLVDGVSQGAVKTYTFSNVSANHTISASFAIDVFTITSSTGENGTISPLGVTNVNYGGTQSFTITPNAGYHVSDVKVDGQSVGVVASYTFSNVTANHSISAAFAINAYTITASSGENGSVTPSGVTSVNYGAGQEYKIVPNTGYHVADVLVDGVSQGAIKAYTFTNVTSNHTISATFAIDVFTITSSTGENGTVSPLGVTNVNYGGTQSYTITPAEGYRVAKVVVDGVSQGCISTYTFSNVTANHTISASFEKNIFTITAASGEHGAVTPAGATTVIYGNNLTYTITPVTGYHVADVLVDGQSVGAVITYTFSNVTANHTISASFAIDLFGVTASSGEHGTISPSGVSNVSYGGSLAYKFYPETGYHVLDVIVDGVSLGKLNNYTFTDITASHTISVSFTIDILSITSMAEEHGTISPLGDINVKYGESKTYTITADKGYHIADVKVDGQSVGAVSTYRFEEVTSDHIISASFAIDLFTITATAGENGSISPSGAKTVNYGASQTFTMVPNTGYIVYCVKVDDQSIGAVASYTFKDVSADHKISVCFQLAKPAAPVLLTPETNTINLPVDFTLTWKEVSFASSYRVQVASDDQFTKLAINDSTFTTAQAKISGLANNTKYYWRVCAANSSGEGAFSEARNFTTVIAPPDKPQLAAPADKCINQPVSLVLSWKKACRANFYTLQVASDSLFQKDLSTSVIQPDTSLATISQNVSGLQNSKKYFWRVNAENQSGAGPFSETWSFTTITPAPGMPLLVTPANNSKDVKDSLKISWKKAKYAEKYNLLLSEDSKFSKVLFVDSLLNDTTKAVKKLKQGSRYFWMVKAKNIAGESQSPEVWSFVTELNSPDSLNVKVLSRNKVRLTWVDRSAGAGAFIIERKQNQDFVIIDTVKPGNTTCIDSTVSVSMSYQYRIRTFTSEVSSVYSNVSSATVTGVSMTNMIPTEFGLSQNYPNPFNPTTVIRFGVPTESRVRIEIYNTLGEKVTEVFNSIQRAGYYEVFFNAAGYSSGVYLCLIYAEATNGSKQFRDVKKMMLIK